MGYILTYLASVLLTANSFCILLHVNGSSDTTRISDLSATIDYRDVVEGENVTLMCNATATGRVYWTHDGRAFSDGRTLNITNITRSLTGLYWCIAYNNSLNTTYTDETGQPNLQKTVYTLFLNVVYPAKILSVVNITSTKVPLNDDFRLRVKVEGNPLPTTTFKSLNDGRAWFLRKESEGTFNISIPSVNCTNTGQYLLSCENDLANASVSEYITVLCSPDPVTDLEVSGVTTNTVNLSFVTGFDNNDRQTFYILREVDGNLTDFKRKVMDSPGDSGGRNITLVIVNLKDSTGYSLTVMSGNSHGNSTHIPNAVTFSTYGKPGPDPRFPFDTTYTPRLGNSLTITMHARGYPVPEYYWSHNGAQVNSTDDKYNSTVGIPKVAVNNYGTYTLNITNAAGIYTQEYQVVADGPPEPVSNLGVFDINETCAHLNFTTGYNYNRTQTFIISRNKQAKMAVLENCTDLTSGRGGDPFSCTVCKLVKDTIYNVTVISKNSRGRSPPAPESVIFSPYGAPQPDPARTTNSTFKPRLGEVVVLSMHAVGYPVPEYQWFHNSIPVNSTDTGYTSEVRIENVVVEDFGKFVLNMTNEAGHFKTVYEILADGPPETVTHLIHIDITSDSVVLSWDAGFDYGSEQSFEVKGTVNNKEYSNPNPILDSTGGKGGVESFLLKHLESSAFYNIYLVAKNQRGTAKMSNEISFATKAGPGKSKTPAAEIVGYVIGGVVGVVLIIVIITVIRRYRRRRSDTHYENGSDEVEEDAVHQPHQYRYTHL